MRYKRMHGYVLAVLMILHTPYAPAQSGNIVTVALIADKAYDLHKSSLVSVLEVELSNMQGIRLLERTEIDRIMAEQQLSVAGLLDRSFAIKVGRLLRVDAFVLLSAEDGGDKGKDRGGLLRVRFVETAHGLRLWDSFEPLDAAKFAEIVQRVTDEVSASTEKLILPAGQVIPVGIIDVHRVQLGENHQWLTRVIPGMLSVRLSKEPRIVMLEREDLEIMRQEKLLTEGEDSEFWNSAVLIDGYLQPGEGKDLQMKLQLKRAAGDEIAAFTVSVGPDEPSLAVDEIAAEMIRELLDAPPTTEWEPKQEAEAFFN